MGAFLTPAEREAIRIKVENMTWINMTFDGPVANTERGRQMRILEDVALEAKIRQIQLQGGIVRKERRDFANISDILIRHEKKIRSNAREFSRITVQHDGLTYHLPPHRYQYISKGPYVNLERYNYDRIGRTGLGSNYNETNEYVATGGMTPFEIVDHLSGLGVTSAMVQDPDIYNPTRIRFGAELLQRIECLEKAVSLNWLQWEKSPKWFKKTQPKPIRSAIGDVELVAASVFNDRLIQARVPVRITYDDGGYDEETRSYRYEPYYMETHYYWRNEAPTSISEFCDWVSTYWTGSPRKAWTNAKSSEEWEDAFLKAFTSGLFNYSLSLLWRPYYNPPC